MPPKVLKMLVGVAVGALGIWLWMGQSRWTGLVKDSAGKPVEGVTVLMMKGSTVADISATESDGTFSFKIDMRADPTLRILFCKMMYEPTGLYPRTPAPKSGAFTIEPAKPDSINPAIETFVATLPPECQQ